MGKNTLSKNIIKSFYIAWKDLRIYYSSPAALMMGLLFPILMFLTFWLGRNLPLSVALPGLAALTVFFGSSSIAVTTLALERAKNTFDTQISMPVPLIFLIIGKTIASCIYGFVITIIPISILALIAKSPTNYFMFLTALTASSLCSSGLGMLLAATAKRVHEAMTPLNIIRIPMMFISGIFLPIESFPRYLQIIAYLMPLTYVVDSLKYSLIMQGTVKSYITDMVALIIFSAVFLVIATKRLNDTLK